jgi:hypothetical protein
MKTTFNDELVVDFLAKCFHKYDITFSEIYKSFKIGNIKVSFIVVRTFMQSYSYDYFRSLGVKPTQIRVKDLVKLSTKLLKEQYPNII